MPIADLFSRLELLRQRAKEQLDKLNQPKPSQLGIGRVLRSGVGTYDLLVDLVGKGPTKCVMATTLHGAPFGYSDSDLPIEGAYVLVATNSDVSDIGYVIGGVGTPGIEDSAEDLPVFPQLPTSAEDGSPNITTERIYDEAISGNKVECVDVGSGKPADVFPGEFVRLNELGVGVDCDMLSARVRGGSAQVAASFVDSTVEIVSRNFRQYDGGGNVILFVDNGFVTKEASFSPFYGERLGGSGTKAPKKEKKKKKTEGDSESGEGNNSEEEQSDDEEDDGRPVGKFRFNTYTGYIGGVFSAFLSKPEKCTDEVKDSDGLRTEDDEEPKDVGLMQFNINDNGRLMYRSAGGVIIERSDLIPVPVRIHSPDDPDGMKSDDVKYEDMSAFEIPKDGDGNQSPHYAILALADKQAYEYKQTYERFLELIEEESDDSGSGGDSGKSDSKDESGGGSDFYLRDEEDLFDDDNPVRDDAGIPDRKIAPDELEYNVGRRSSLLMPPDGSVIIRDAWGSEIIMSGGNITINTPGSIITAPGKSMICLAGDDAVVKARNSVDVIASEHDITINGNRAVKIVGGSDQAAEAGGVLIESLSQFSTIDTDGEDNAGGEDATFTGITLKATNSHITSLGKTSVFGASEELRVVTGSTGEKEDARDGRVVISTKQFGVSSPDGITLASSDSGVIITKNDIAMAGDSVAIAGKGGVVFSTSSQIGVPLWLDAGFDLASGYIKNMSDYCMKEQDGKKNKPVELGKYLDKQLFTYRTSDQCHTLKGLEITDRPDNFTLYQPFWTIMSDLKISTLGGAKTTTWEEHTIDGEYPWPGSDAMKDGKYARLSRKDGDPTKNTKVIELRGKKRNGEDQISTVLCSEKFGNIVNSSDISENDGKNGSAGETGSSDEDGTGQISVDLAGLDAYVVYDVDFEDEDEDKKD